MIYILITLFWFLFLLPYPSINIYQGIFTGEFNSILNIDLDTFYKFLIYNFSENSTSILSGLIITILAASLKMNTVKWFCFGILTGHVSLVYLLIVYIKKGKEELNLKNIVSNKLFIYFLISFIIFIASLPTRMFFNFVYITKLTPNNYDLITSYSSIRSLGFMFSNFILNIYLAFQINKNLKMLQIKNSTLCTWAVIFGGVFALVILEILYKDKEII